MKQKLPFLRKILWDITLILFSWIFAYQIRFNFIVPVEYLLQMKFFIPFIVPPFILTFYFFGVYRMMWRYVSLFDVKNILVAVFVAGSFLLIFKFLFLSLIVIPRSVIILFVIFLPGTMILSRLATRVVITESLFSKYNDTSRPLVIIGSGNLLVRLLRELSYSNEWKVVAILNENKYEYGNLVHGVRIFGDYKWLSHFKSKFKVNHIVLANNLAIPQNKKILSYAMQLNMHVLSTPSLSDSIMTNTPTSPIKKITMDDLLGRQPVKLMSKDIKNNIFNHVILVSGAAGSIGSELVSQLIKFKPRMLICVDISEASMFKLQQLIFIKFPKQVDRFQFFVCDIKNVNKISNIISSSKPSVVFHAAAYKHVPLMEKLNASQALINNSYGTYIFGKTCAKHYVNKFILISTDKAINPTNIMGASKTFAEFFCSHLQNNTNTEFSTVRFGNVLGSSGSVIPIFTEQIESGGPVTITHPDITRYFMSISEACQLVIQAGSMSYGGQIYVLDMGSPVKIYDLAKKMIKLLGFDDADIKITFVGLRPGEKLFEELLSKHEALIKTSHEKIFVAESTRKKINVNEALKWIKQTENMDEQQIKKELPGWIKTYSQKF